MKFNKKQLTLGLLFVALVSRMYAAADDDMGMQEYAKLLPWGSLVHKVSPVESGVSGISPLAMTCAHTQARLMVQYGDFEASIALLERIVSDSPNKPDLQANELFNIGLIYRYSKKDYRKAIEKFTQALRIPNGLSPLRICRVFTHLEEMHALIAQEISVSPVVTDVVEQPVRRRKRHERKPSGDGQNVEGANASQAKRQRVNHQEGSLERLYCAVCKSSYANRYSLHVHKHSKGHKTALRRLEYSGRPLRIQE